jgi:hypothetical protein
MTEQVTKRTEWMMPRSVTVESTAIPRIFVDDKGEENSVAAIRIRRNSGVGAVVIEGRPEDLVEFARQVTVAARQAAGDTDATPELRALYGRTD